MSDDQKMKQIHKQLFCELVQRGEIASRCRARSTFNIPFPTAGGKVFWDSYNINEWKLQENVFFGNWRILDPSDERLAWGIDEKQLDAFLNDRPTSFIANYLDNGYSFSRYGGTNSETIIMLHGWGVRANSMAEQAEMLNHRGWTVLNYDYPSSEKHIEQHAEIFLSLLRKERLQGKLHFLTHSMGGLILRYALAKMNEAECRMIDSIVMLGPPNRGSLLALIGEVDLVKLFNASLGDMVPGARTLHIPKPIYLPPVGIIAGTLDGKVALENTGLPDGLPFQRITVNCTHPGLRDPGNTGKAIIHFMKHKTFKI